MELLLRRQAYDRVAEAVLAAGEVLHAPHLLDLELTEVFRRLERANALEGDRASQALEDLAALRLVRHPHQPLLGRVWELRQNLTVSEATYVALAESLDAPLITLDQRIAGASGHRARVRTL